MHPHSQRPTVCNGQFFSVRTIPNHIFNLALAYERRGLERETLAALRLNPGQPDAWNSLGVI